MDCEVFLYSQINAPGLDHTKGLGLIIKPILLEMLTEERFAMIILEL